MIDGTPAGTPVPELVRATNIAISHGFMDYVDCNKVPAAPLPYGPQTEFQVTSPVVGTVDLKGLTDINGTALPDSETDITHPVSGADIPQRSNVMITTAFALPNFEGKLRAVRVYKPVVDSTKPTGYKFTQDGTKLWVASHAGRGEPQYLHRDAERHDDRADRRKRRDARAVHERVGGRGHAHHHVRAIAAAGAVRRFDAGVHGSAVDRPSARRGISGVHRRAQRSPDADLGGRQRRHDARHRRDGPASRCTRSSPSTFWRS